MRLYTVMNDGAEALFVSCDGGKNGYFLRDLGFAWKDMNELIMTATPGDMDALRRAPETAQAAPVPVADLKLCSPIVRPRQDVVCLGLNYRDHVREAERAQGDTRDEYAVYFCKHCSAAIGDGDLIPMHADICDSLDYECELGVIIGRDAYGVTAEEAPDYIFGYTVVNDVSARNLQFRHKQWLLGKSLDGHTSIGPCIVTPDEVGDPTRLQLRCYVNGELRQNNNTANMITGICDTIADLTAGMTLQAGSIISTGTPSGVALGMEPPVWLKKGDEVICEVENVGRLTNTVGD